MLVLGNGWSLHIWKFVYFVFCAIFLHIDESVFSSTSLFVIQNSAIFASWILKPWRGKMPFAAIRFFSELFIHSYTSLSIQIAAALQVEMTDNSSRWKPKITDDMGDIHPTRSPYIRRNQCQTEGASLFPRCIFCDVWEFYAFNDPCFALYQKQDMAEYTERTTLLPPLSAVLLPDEELLWYYFCLSYTK